MSEEMYEQEFGRRRDRAQHSRPNVPTDKLPPHDEAAEAGVLGCLLLDQTGLKEVMERFGGDKVFFVLPNQRILEAMTELNREGLAIDLVTVQSRLRDWGELDQIGGVPYLTALMDATPSAANLPSYLDIVWEKYLARSLVQNAQHQIDAVMQQNGASEAMLARVKREQEEFDKKSQRGAVSPQLLKRAEAFADDCYAQLFRDPMKGEPGLELPIPFPFKIRRKEATLVSADDKSGKSTLLSFFSLHLAEQDPGVCVASFEEPPAISLWRLCSQLLGRKHLPDTDAGRQQAIAAIAWLNKRFWFYDFLGISNWRDVLDTFRYAAEKHGVWLFVLDSVMRIGIPDDDYAQQATAAAAFAQFAMDYDAHMFFVIHENKADAKGKAKIRGSKLWSANANNILQVSRNVDKGEKTSKLEWQLSQEHCQVKPDQDAIRELSDELDKMRKDWDCHLVMRGQRWLGSQQNGSKYFWFDRESFQFRAHWQDMPVNWLDRWKKRKGE